MSEPCGAIVILSGGLDSTVCMAVARRDTERPPLALSFDYGQRHLVELERARAVAAFFGSEHLIVALDATRWGGSALTDTQIDVPDAESTETIGAEIPVTYVPGRNTIFLAVGLAVAEARDAEAVYVGVNELDSSGYPDCRPEYLDAMREVARLGQRRGVEGRPVSIRAPLVGLDKAGIIRLGRELGAPLELTWSCYRGEQRPCGTCDACRLRAKGFAEAGIADPALDPPPNLRP
jgi:7-cyano-7-deazaguanine synthase